MGQHGSQRLDAASALAHWLERNALGLLDASVSAEIGRGPTLDGRPRAVWISFATRHLLGRVVLWSSSKCELNVSRRDDGTPILTEELLIRSPQELDMALVAVMDILQAEGVSKDPLFLKCAEGSR